MRWRGQSGYLETRERGKGGISTEKFLKIVMEFLISFAKFADSRPDQ
jgi:hypothetical protein